MLPGAGAEGQACPRLQGRQPCPLESHVTAWAQDSSRGTKNTLMAWKNIHSSARLLSACHVPGTIPGSKDGAREKTDPTPALFSPVGTQRKNRQGQDPRHKKGVVCPVGITGSVLGKASLRSAGLSLPTGGGEGGGALPGVLGGWNVTLAPTWPGDFQALPPEPQPLW